MSEEKELVCYCFSYSRQEIREDAVTHGRSTIMERIMAESKAGGCNCAARNPKSR
ncbi:MAG: (2Fe-2S)-binding protein [Deltaproteobacteria bacterium]|nr:(2Fe-2S)-binding protein [Deltaproteobacteria bacterium]